MKLQLFAGALVVASVVASGAAATTFTRTSPTGGALPSGVTEVGGVVLDFRGLNGARVVTQAPASSLFVGQPNFTPLTFGSQSGFSAGVISALGGGLSSASARITLFDGDTAPGNFDFNDLTFSIDTAVFGNWSGVTTQETSSDGLTLLSSTTGFQNNMLSTGWFSLVDAIQLGNLFASLGDGTLNFSLTDPDPGDNYYDFTQGVDGGLINVGTGPIVTPPPPMGAVPEPATWAMMLTGFFGLGAVLRTRRREDTLFA